MGAQRIFALEEEEDLALESGPLEEEEDLSSYVSYDSRFDSIHDSKNRSSETRCESRFNYHVADCKMLLHVSQIKTSEVAQFFN
ncbi:hypothetical protein RIF29_40209 [Crotalaria pallida]|uniref:Uncharacterized protein n=1 Tax=Crotalaria pallida TaxID=3830 RepID=A0AAN9HQG2_CROPI